MKGSPVRWGAEFEQSERMRIEADELDRRAGAAARRALRLNRSGAPVAEAGAAFEEAARLGALALEARRVSVRLLEEAVKRLLERDSWGRRGC